MSQKKNYLIYLCRIGGGAEKATTEKNRKLQRDENSSIAKKKNLKGPLLIYLHCHRNERTHGHPRDVDRVGCRGKKRGGAKKNRKKNPSFFMSRTHTH